MEKNKTRPNGASGRAGKPAYRTGRYIKYAVGEIILVVIGILIALQINTWNNNRIERKIEKDILTEIVSNLDFDLENIENRINHNRTFAKHNQIIYEHLKNKTPLTDSLKYYYSWLLGYGNFQPMTVAYENLKSLGINIVKNENLRKEISKLYDFTYIAEVKTHIPSLAHIHQIFTEQVNEHLVTETSYQSAQPVDLIALQNDIQFQETLKSIVFARKWSNKVLDDAKESIFNLKISIEEELKVKSK